MADTAVDVPPPLYEAILGFIRDQKHGNITLNIKAGQIVSWSLTEIGRIDKCKDPALE